ADSRQILENMVHAAQPRPVTEDHVVFLASIDAPHGAAWQAAVAGLVGWLDHVARVIAEQWRRRVREVCADHPTTPGGAGNELGCGEVLIDVQAAARTL